MASEQKDYPPKPRNERSFKKPVAWLLGRQLISGFKRIALYSAFKAKLDSRDWMHPEVIPLDQARKGEFWFDYLADTGDGQKATYSIAYLCMSDLWVKDPPDVGSNVGFDSNSDRTVQLPRGAFLFVGGDTSYHIADYATLGLRFKNPFCWAFEDLQNMGKISGERRPIFGIPGNHDYYDALDGFNRQFRRPRTKEDQANRRGQRPQLSIPGFARRQDASYVALRLPFDWWFWGLDAQEGRIDVRQQEFFQSCNGGRVPEKLIVATPEPTTVFGKYAEPSSKLSVTFKNLGLERPFLRDGKGEKLSDGKCRLDLAGDVHHYARYWGPTSKGSTTSTPSASNYASVVSGLGGAFLHPSQTNVHEVEQQALYPAADDSRTQVAKRILNPWNIIRGGYIWLFGAIAATVVYFAATAPDSTRVVVDTVLTQVPGISHGRLLEPTGLFSTFADSASSLVQNVGLKPFLCSMVLWFLAALSVIFVCLSVRFSEKPFRRAYIRSVTNRDYWPVWVFLLAAVGTTGFGIWRFGQFPAAQLFSDLVFMTVVVGIILGLVVLASVVGGNLHGRGGKIGFAAMGVWHALLQLAVPFLLVRIGDWWALVSALILWFVFIWIGIGLAIRNARWLLVLAWLLHGGLQLYLPIYLSGSSLQLPHSWALMLPYGIVFLLGAFMSCVWFGWYLVVSLAFNGHNNEAGGAARIEGFKQFIRFRLTEDTLTGYVIGVDDPKIDGRHLQPEIVDAFRLTARQQC